MRGSASRGSARVTVLKGEEVHKRSAKGGRCCDVGRERGQGYYEEVRLL